MNWLEARKSETRENMDFARQAREFRRQRLQKLIAEGLPLSVISERMGMSVGHVQNELRRFRLRNVTPEKDWLP